MTPYEHGFAHVIKTAGLGRGGQYAADMAKHVGSEMLGMAKNVGRWGLGGATVGGLAGAGTGIAEGKDLKETAARAAVGAGLGGAAGAGTRFLPYYVEHALW